MAAIDSDDEYDEVGVTELTLEELVLTNPLPQRAKVTVGYEDPHDPDCSFSTGDVIEVHSHLLIRTVCKLIADLHSGTDHTKQV